MPRQRQSFDPYAILNALEREDVAYIIVGAFARVIHGAPELTRGIDIVPWPRTENLKRLEKALAAIDAKRPDGAEPSLTAGLPQDEVVALRTAHGEVKIVPEPPGTRHGYDDLRRRASREPIGRGLRPRVAAPEDLVRMLAALGREADEERLRQMRRVVELGRGRGLRLEL